MDVRWECRAITENVDFEHVVDLEINIWKLEPRDAVPTNLLHAMAANGSFVAGAYDGSKMVGMALAFPAVDVRKKILWSHMTGVLPEYQGRGVGFALKQFQRMWALEHGYNTIKWTFDPLQRGNANFNLHVLGAMANIYHVNYYGEMTDGINAGLPSDRLEVVWNLRNPRVKALASGISSLPPRKSYPQEEHLLLRAGEAGQPIRQFPDDLQVKSYFIEIPANISAVKENDLQAALSWRLMLRDVLQAAFNKGYSALDFVEVQGHSYYVIEAPETWYLYLLACDDGTLYTGITPDLQARVQLHNAGRGAKYTASRLPVQLKGAWLFLSRSSAMRAEIAFKNLSRSKKLRYVENHLSFHEAPFIAPD